MNNLEEVIAVIEPQEVYEETRLTAQVTVIEATARNLLVENDEQYKVAGEFGIVLKEKMAEVSEFFAPMKKAAHDAHKKVCDREKEMLTPLKNAETILKKSMGAYAMRKEQERRAAEAEARRLAKEEADRKLAEAIAAEEKGDAVATKNAMLDAEIADTVSRMVAIEDNKPTAKGVSVQKDWEITEIDLTKVPDSLMGVLIRPVDKAAVMKLIRSSKGTIKIEGITYQETTKMSFRRA